MESSMQDKVTGTLQNTFGEHIINVEMLYDFLTITVKKEKIIEVFRHLYDHPELEFQFLTDLCGVHYPDAPEQLSVVYHLHSLVNNLRIRLKIYMPIENPVVPTLTGIFAAANWMERETYDFYGIIFEGHPNLTRILNVDEMLVFPMRKEFPLEDQNREDKKDYMFGR